MRPRMYQKTKQVFPPSVPPLSCESPRIPDSENGPAIKSEQIIEIIEPDTCHPH